MIRFAWLMLVLGACSVPGLNREGRACDQGTCIAGYTCNASNICVLAAGGTGTTVKRIKLALTANPSEALSDVPMLVVLTPQRVDYADFASDGSDIAFFDSRNEPLPSSVELWQPGGTSSVWVKAPSLSAAGNFVWMNYGAGQSGGTLPSTQVWSNGFVGVWHLGEDAATASSNAIYADASGNESNGLECVSATDKAGLVGNGQSFAGADTIAVPSSTSLTLTSAASVELAAECPSMGYAHVIALDHATPSAGFPIEVDLDPATFDYTHAASDGSDLRFYDSQGTSASYWLEKWTPGGASIAWVKVANAGETTLSLLSGATGLSATSDATQVLQANGLLSTTFDFTPQGVVSTAPATAPSGTLSAASFYPGDESGLNALFAFASFSSRFGWGPSSTINCDMFNCNTFSSSALNYYATLFEGWYVTPTATCLDFGVDGDDAVDLHLDGSTNWAVFDGAHPSIANYYGKHGASEDYTSVNGSFQPPGLMHVASSDQHLSAGYHRLSFRYSQADGGSAYRLAAKACGTSTYAVVPASAFAYRTRADPQPSATVGAEVVLDAGVAKGGLSLLCNGAHLTARTTGAVVQVATPAAGWHYFALSFDAAHLDLYVDGALATSVAATQPLDTGTSALTIGSLAGVSLPFLSHLDEVRVANVARSAGWFALQQLSLTDKAWTYGAPEVVTP